MLEKKVRDNVSFIGLNSKGKTDSVKSPYLQYIEKNTAEINKSFNSRFKPSRRIDPLNYSDIFSYKMSVSTNANTTNLKSLDEVPETLQKPNKSKIDEDKKNNNEKYYVKEEKIIQTSSKDEI